MAHLLIQKDVPSDVDEIAEKLSQKHLESKKKLKLPYQFGVERKSYKL